MAETDGQFSACRVELGEGNSESSLEVPVNYMDLKDSKTFEMSCNTDVEAVETYGTNVGDQSSVWPAEMVLRGLNESLEDVCEQFLDGTLPEWNWKSRHKDILL